VPMPRRLLGLSVCLLLLVPACGGSAGDSSPAPSADNPFTPNPGPATNPNLEFARGVLEGCAAEHTALFLDLLASLQAAADPMSTGPTIALTGFNVITATASFTADLEPDGTADVTGTLRFTDAVGAPTFPFSPLDILTMPFADLLATMPDGTRMAVDFTMPGASTLSGTVATRYLGGMPATASGTVAVDGGDCDAMFSFDEIDAGALQGGAIPTATMDSSITSAQGHLDATMTFDGTPVVTIDTEVGGEAFRFLLDLQTGMLTAAP
jgi:hypothetical protein